MTVDASLSFVLQVDDVAGASQLRAELDHLQLESVEAVTARTSQLAVVVPPVTLPRLIDFIHAWCARNQGRSVVIKSVATPQSAFTGVLHPAPGEREE